MITIAVVGLIDVGLIDVAGGGVRAKTIEPM